jgi:hypothetical protein
MSSSCGGERGENISHVLGAALSQIPLSISRVLTLDHPYYWYKRVACTDGHAPTAGKIEGDQQAKEEEEGEGEMLNDEACQGGYDFPSEFYSLVFSVEATEHSVSDSMGLISRMNQICRLIMSPNVVTASRGVQKRPVIEMS